MADKKKKKTSRFKKVVKNLLKAATVGTLGYGAAKMFGGRKGNVSKTAASEDANVGINTGPGLIDAQDAGTNFVRQPRVPDRITSPLRPSIPNRRKVDSGFINKISPGLAYGQQFFGAKKGGRVTGIAKRGFGRALMKGKK